jgi:hypothetical protein
MVPLQGRTAPNDEFGAVLVLECGSLRCRFYIPNIYIKTYTSQTPAFSAYRPFRLR